MPGYVWAFETVAVRTGESQVVLRSPATMLFGDDVVNLKRQQERPFGEQAVFAACTLGGLPNELSIHWGPAERSELGSNRRERDCRTASRRLICK